MEEIPELSRPRYRIEDELILKHKALQRKIDALKVRRYKEEIQHNQSAPTINLRSSRLARRSEKSTNLSSSHLDLTHELLHNSRFFRRKAKISLIELSKSLSQTTLAKPQLKNSANSPLPKSLTSSDTLIKFPSLLQVSKQLAESKSSSTILTRNKLLASLREETTIRGFANEPEEPPSMLIHERNQIWLKKKNEKISEMREKQENKNLFGCTFKPALQDKRIASLNNSLRSSSAASSYASLHERKKGLRSASKIPGVYSSHGRFYNSSSISSMNSLRLNEKILTSLRPAYTPLCPVTMNLSNSGFKDSSTEVHKTKRKFIKII